MPPFRLSRRPSLDSRSAFPTKSAPEGKIESISLQRGVRREPDFLILGCRHSDSTICVEQDGPAVQNRSNNDFDGGSLQQVSLCRSADPSRSTDLFGTMPVGRC
jgi:hypothetical protein